MGPGGFAIAVVGVAIVAGVAYIFLSDDPFGLHEDESWAVEIMPNATASPYVLAISFEIPGHPALQGDLLGAAATVTSGNATVHWDATVRVLIVRGQGPAQIKAVVAGDDLGADHFSCEVEGTPVKRLDGTGRIGLRLSANYDIQDHEVLLWAPEIEIPDGVAASVAPRISRSGNC